MNARRFRVKMADRVSINLMDSNAHVLRDIQESSVKPILPNVHPYLVKTRPHVSTPSMDTCAVVDRDTVVFSAKPKLMNA